MAFFDEIGKKISQTGQVAVQKTKQMADVAKLNSDISDEEKKLTNIYFQIGQLYVSLHNNDPESDFEVLIDQLNETQTKIENLRQQIQDIKGVKRCATCGAEIPSNSTFCSSCGTAVIQPKAVDAADLIKCANCGKMIEKSMKFCTFCGSKMDIQSARNNANKCTACGAVIENGIAFCTNCGTPVHKDIKKSDEINTDLTSSDVLKAQPTNELEEINSEIVEQNEIVIPEQSVQTAENRCKTCGALLEEDSLFCTSCGAKIN